MRCRIVFTWSLIFLITWQAFPCTIISGKTKNNFVWFGNNEDFFFDFNYYLNVFPRQGKLLGMITFTCGSPESVIQGGMNEAGVFLDWNAFPPEPQSAYRDWDKKKDYPGGAMALDLQILRNCTSVLEVRDLFNQYRDPEFLSAQMHIADKLGNLAIVNAKGFRIAQGPYQVSTNYNVLTNDPSQAKACWRYPIAERMLKENGVSFENVRNILDATQQKKLVGTIYSNVANLTTGDVYNYYGGDFAIPYHFKLSELLAKGKKSYLWRSLFPESPLVKVWEVYLARGPQAALEEYRRLESKMPEKRKMETLRHSFSSCLLRLNKYADARIFFEEWLKVGGSKDENANFYNALIQLSNGRYDRARERLADQIKTEAKDISAQKSNPPSRAELLLSRLQGVKPAGANVRFVLKGHTDAKFVCVAGLGYMAVTDFLLRTGDGWAGDFALPAGKNHYAFLVDGRLLLDSENSVVETVHTDDGKIVRYNVKIVR
jgi:tetratricopeptide (TPR) repeat protein